jgi:hypothetical protein
MWYRQSSGTPRTHVQPFQVPAPIRIGVYDFLQARGFDRAFGWYDEHTHTHTFREHAPLSTDSARTYYVCET